jgi:hypothetical protein
MKTELRAPCATRVFVAYPFTREAQSIVDRLVRPVLEQQGRACITGTARTRRVSDGVETLKASIASCSTLVAVVAGRNPNVFFEVGVASALSKPCILLASTPGDAGMLRGTHPVIAMAPEESAMRELALLLSSQRREVIHASVTA